METHYKKLGKEDVNMEFVKDVIGMLGGFCEERLVPLSRVGDTEGCKLVNGTVKAAPGFKEAYEEYAAGGWQALTVPEEYGGQGLPQSLGIVKSELMACANWSFGMFPGLSLGCMNTLYLHGSEEQKQTYLTKVFIHSRGLGAGVAWARRCRWCGVRTRPPAGLRSASHFLTPHYSPLPPNTSWPRAPGRAQCV